MRLDCRWWVIGVCFDAKDKNLTLYLGPFSVAVGRFP